MAFWDRARDVGRAALALIAFYAAFLGLLWAAQIVEWAALEGLRAAGGFGAVHAWESAGRGLIPLAVPGLVAALALYALLARANLGGRTTFGWPERPVRRALAGAGVGAGLAVAAVALSLAGGARLTVEAGALARYLAVALPVLAGLALAAALEELVFRGWPLSRLARSTGPGAAAVTVAVLFSVAHVWNPDVAPLGLLNIGLASLLLSVVFFGPGGLAAAWGLHAGWNAGLALGADAPVSGLVFQLPAVAYDPGPREWLTGGPFGPEGGLAATLVLGAAVGWWGRQLIRAREQATA